MKTFATILAATLISSAALAQSTTVIQKEGPDGDKTVVRHESMDGTVTKKVETTGAAGCSTQSVKRTNDDGDSVTKTKTDC